MSAFGVRELLPRGVVGQGRVEGNREVLQKFLKNPENKEKLQEIINSLHAFLTDKSYNDSNREILQRLWRKLDSGAGLLEKLRFWFQGLGGGSVQHTALLAAKVYLLVKEAGFVLSTSPRANSEERPLSPASSTITSPLSSPRSNASSDYSSASSDSDVEEVRQHLGPTLRLQRERIQRKMRDERRAYKGLLEERESLLTELKTRLTKYQKECDREFEAYRKRSPEQKKYYREELFTRKNRVRDLKEWIESVEREVRKLEKELSTYPEPDSQEEKAILAQLEADVLQTAASRFASLKEEQRIEEAEERIKRTKERKAWLKEELDCQNKTLSKLLKRLDKAKAAQKDELKETIETTTRSIRELSQELWHI